MKSSNDVTETYLTANNVQLKVLSSSTYSVSAIEGA